MDTPPPRPDVIQTVKVLAVFFALGALAGLFRSLARRLHVRDTLLAAGVSGVGGVVVGALCTYGWGPDRWYLTCAVCGLAGWAGGNLVLDRLTFVAWTIVRGYWRPPTILVPPPVQPAPPVKESK